MNQHAVVNKFSHVKPGDTEFTGGGLREFFLYRDLGVAAATGGRVIAQLVKANEAPENRRLKNIGSSLLSVGASPAEAQSFCPRNPSSNLIPL